MNKFFLFISLLFLIACEQTADIDPAGNGLYLKYYGNGILRDVLSDIPEGRSLSLLEGNEILGVGTLAERNIDSIISQVYVFRLNSNGMISNDILIGEDSINKAVDIIKDSNGNHYLLYNTLHNNHLGFRIAKLNNGLESLWDKNYSIQTENQGRAINVDASGNIVMLGNYNSKVSGKSKMFTAKIDPQGATLWVDSLGVDGNDNPVGKTISIFMQGNERYAWCGNDLNKNPVKPKIILSDEEGNAWLNEGIEADENLKETGSELLRLENGNFLIVGSINITDNDSDLRLVRLNNDGQIIWVKHFGGPLNEQGISICQADDLGFLLAGTTESSDNGKSDIYIIKTDNAGEKLWEKTFGGPENDIASKIIKVDGGYAIIGTSEVAGTKLITVIRIDLDGNIL